MKKMDMLKEPKIENNKIRKKVLITANLGGFVGFLLSDIKILQSMGYEVHYAANCVASNWKDNENELKKMNVKIFNLEFNSKKPISLKNLIAYIKLKRLINKENYVMIHCHTPITGIVTRLAAKKYRKNKGCKIIYTTHGFTFSKYSSKRKWKLYYGIEKFLSKYSDGIITINKEDYNIAKTMYCKKVYYINGVGVNIKKYSNVTIDKNIYRKQNNIPTDKIMILSIGELSERKNHQIIIKAISTLENKNDYVYVICGTAVTGNIEHMLRKLAKESEVNLILLGFRNDIPELIKCSDIGAIPSVREGLGLAGIQSLAGGIPLVATGVQGIKDYVIDGKTGFLASPFDEKAFAKNIKILSKEKKRDEMRSKCQKKANEFDLLISEQQRKKIYEDLLKRG